MVRLQQNIIRFYLNLERVCLESRGKGLVVDGSTVERSSTSCWQIALAILYLFVAFGLSAGYYYWHFKFYETNEEQEQVYDVVFLVDLLTFSTIASFPFYGPVHYALGYFECNDPVELQSRILRLFDDRGTQQLVSLTLWCGVIYLFGDLLFFISAFDSMWKQLAYVPFVIGNVWIFYGGMLLIVLAMRVILVRLYVIEHQVEEALDLTEPRDYQSFRNSILYQQEYHAQDDEEQGHNRASLITAQSAERQKLNPNRNAINDTNNGDNDDNQAGADSNLGISNPSGSRPYLDPDQRALEWTQSYRLIRHDVHEISEHFGVPMLAGILLFTCEVTSMVAAIWEEVGQEIGTRGVVCLMICFSTNAIMVCAAMYSMASLILECSHHIGPKLAVLAVRCHDHAPRFQVLATTFMHAPVKIHVGIFEVSTEYASAIGLWFLGLFLVVFGLKMPGAE